jgi:hypothetical protein
MARWVDGIGRPRHGWQDNFKMDLQEAGAGSVDWIDLRVGTKWRALVNAVMNV